MHSSGLNQTVCVKLFGTLFLGSFSARQANHMVHRQVVSTEHRVYTCTIVQTTQTV